MHKEITFEDEHRLALYKILKKLSIEQFKIFYGAFVHYLVNHKCFINKQNLFNLRCEMNFLCHELDESFPHPYDDYEVMSSFFRAHPYYYMDKLPVEQMAKLFAECVDDRIDILTTIAQIIFDKDMHSAYVYANNALGLNEPVDTLVAQAQAHIKYFS